MTPEQMRALAAQHEERARWTTEGESGAKWFRDTAAALRDAADQLEALQRWAIETVGHAVRTSNQFDIGYNSAAGDVQAILTDDTAPQEDRDE